MKQDIARLACLILLVGGLLGAAEPACAQRLALRVFSEAEGAPSSAFGSAVQDEEGRLWTATRAGLAVYDGVSWRLETDPDGLMRLAFGTIGLDGAGRIWIAAQATPPRIFCRDAAGWHSVASPEALVPAWGSDINLMAVEPVADEPRVAIVDQANRIFLYVGGRWRAIELAPGARIHCLSWQDGQLLAATASGLFKVDCPPEGPDTVTADRRVPDGAVYAVIPATSGHPVTVVGQGWIGTLGEGGFQPLFEDLRLAFSAPYLGVSAARDSIGGVWIGDRGMVFHWHPLTGLAEIEPRHGLPSGGTTGILVDREGQVWITNPRGLSVLADQRLQGFQRTTGLFADEVSSILHLPDGRTLLGHEGGVTFMEGEPTPLTIANRERTGRVMGMCSDGAGGAWLACGLTGLVRVTADGSASIVYRPEESVSWLSSVVPAGGDSLWVSSHAGLYVYRDGRMRMIDLDPVPLAGSPSLRKVCALPAGGAVVTSARRGVAWVEGADVRWVTATEAAANSTYDVFDAGGGVWWVGTGAGLRRIVDGAIVGMGEQDPVIERPVYAITADGEGRVWFGTDAGVRIWDGSHLAPITPANGLLGAECNRDALKLDALGRMWIGTDRGLNIWDPRLAGPRPAPPRARIEGFEVDGEARPAGAALELDAAVREVRINVRSDGLAAGQRQLYQTFLEGFDNGWSEPHPLPDGVLRYTGLPAGRYRFLVRALDSGGAAGPVAASLGINVARPLWRRPWVIVLNVAALLVVAWLVSGGISARRYARRLEEEVQSRTAELAATGQQVRRESQRLAVVLGSIGDGVVVVDAAGRMTLANPAAAALAGASDHALTGRLLEEALPGITPLVREAAAAAMTGTSTFVGAGGTFRYHAVVTNRDLDVAVAALEADADGSRVLALRDVTGRRRSEDERMLLRRLESLAGLAGGIAHDFNNLLTIVQGHAAELRHEPGLTAEAATNLGFIEGAAAEARVLVGRLLTFARGDEPSLAPVDIAAVAVASAELVAAGDGIRLVTELAPDLRPVLADRGQIVQVLGNLLLNARQAMPRGGNLLVTGRNVVGSAGVPMVEIEIADEGMGIAAADIDRVFDPYFTTKRDGTGMGLAIAHAVVVRHGGRLAVRSQQGKGTVFTLQLPAAPPGPGSA